MQWLIQKTKNRPKLKKWILFVGGMIIKCYMFFTNKTKGINEKKVVFTSFKGKSYSDNPKAISEKLYEMYPEVKIVWLFNNPEEKEKIVPSYVKCVKTRSLRSFKELATAKVWVDNFCKPVYVYKNKKQTYIQTWHGDRGFKKILYDSTFVSPGYKIIESEICDLAISGSKYGDMQYRSAFKYDGEILRKGYPRNDILVHNNKDAANMIKNSLGIKKTTKTLLYAPTLRREASGNESNQDIGEIDLIEILDVLQKKTNEQWICLTRAHSAVKGLSGIPNNENFLDVSWYEDMKDILLISDMLITDYSSSAGDFALLERPIILFQNDRKEYLEKDRTFYFDIDDSPFLVAMNQDQLIDIIKNMNMDSIRKNCKDILEFYGTNETGQSSEHVANYIISKIRDEN